MGYLHFLEVKVPSDNHQVVSGPEQALETNRSNRRARNYPGVPEHRRRVPTHHHQYCENQPQMIGKSVLSMDLLFRLYRPEPPLGQPPVWLRVGYHLTQLLSLCPSLNRSPHPQSGRCRCIAVTAGEGRSLCLQSFPLKRLQRRFQHTDLLLDVRYRQAVGTHVRSDLDRFFHRRRAVPLTPATCPFPQTGSSVSTIP